jgi:hypothetical protein
LRNRYHQRPQRAGAARDRGRHVQAAQSQGGLIVFVYGSRIAKGERCQDG